MEIKQIFERKEGGRLRISDWLGSAPSSKLIELLLDEPWHGRCEIIPDYMPPFPNNDTRPTMQVRYNNGTEYPAFLRYSHGPKQGFFWDIYGDDMHSVEVAILAISQAPAPANVGPIVFKIPLQPKEPNVPALAQSGGEKTSTKESNS